MKDKYNSLEYSTALCTVQYSRLCSNDYLPAPGPHMRLHLLSADQGPHGFSVQHIVHGHLLLSQYLYWDVSVQLQYPLMYLKFFSIFFLLLYINIFNNQRQITITFDSSWRMIIYRTHLEWRTLGQNFMSKALTV